MLTARKIAAAEGKTRYKGSKCKGCNGTERYVSNNNCFECSKKHAKEYDQRIRAQIKALRKERV
tara:strand:- start:2286 stop:2477 length:192 start_codon:yes stop_codon:yes gene_type:complete